MLQRDSLLTSPLAPLPTHRKLADFAKSALQYQQLQKTHMTDERRNIPKKGVMMRNSGDCLCAPMRFYTLLIIIGMI